MKNSRVYYTDDLSIYEDMIDNVPIIYTEVKTPWMLKFEGVTGVSFVPAINLQKENNIGSNYELKSNIRNDYVVAVFSQEDKNWKTVAKSFAKYKRARIEEYDSIEGLFNESIDSSTKYITLIGNSMHFDESLLQSIKLYQIKRIPNIPAVGFMVADNLTLLTQLIFKNAIYNNISSQENLFISISEEMNKQNDVSGIHFNDWQPKELAQNKASILEVFNIHSHAREDHLTVKDAIICPIQDNINSTNLFEKTENKRLPACFYDGTCYRTDKKRSISLQDIQAKVAFTNACSTFRLTNGIFENNYNIINGMLNGWPAVFIGSSVIKDGLATENLYFQYMYESGQTVGEIVNTLNINAYIRKTDFFNFMILGDPEFKINTPIRRIQSEEQYTVDLAKKQIFVEKEVSIGCIPFKDRDYTKVSNTYLGDSQRNIHTMIRQEEGIIYLDFFCWGKIPPGVLSIEEAHLSTRDYILKRLVPTIDNLENTYVYSLRDQKITNKVKNLKNQINNLAKYVNTFNDHLKDAETENKKIIKLEDELSNLETLLMRNLVEKTNKSMYHFFESYHEYSLVDNVEEGPTCPHCNNKTYRVDLNLFTRKNYYRRTLKCPACGVIEDVPDYSLLLEVDYDYHCTQETSILGKFKIRNMDKENINASVGIAVLHAKDNRISLDSLQEIDTVSLHGNDKKEVSFKLNISMETIPHLQYLRLYVVKNGDIYMLNGPFWIHKNFNREL